MTSNSRASHVGLTILRITVVADIIIKRKILLFTFAFDVIAEGYVQLFDTNKLTKSVNTSHHTNTARSACFLFVVTLRVSDPINNYNDTIYVHLYIDLSPNWMHQLSNRMNVSTRSYDAQTQYFQSIVSPSSADQL